MGAAATATGFPTAEAGASSDADSLVLSCLLELLLSCWLLLSLSPITSLLLSLGARAGRFKTRVPEEATPLLADTVPPAPLLADPVPPEAAAPREGAAVLCFLPAVLALLLSYSCCFAWICV